MAMTSPRTLVRLLMLLALSAGCAMADTQPSGADIVPRITVSSNGEAVAPAARATLVIGIESVATTAAAAGAADARLAHAVADALAAAGLPAADLAATHLVINPQWTYDDHSHQRRRTGFQADTTLMIDTTDLNKLGNWVDAALGAGATNVSDPRFSAADDAALRHLALSRAVQNARADAQILAAAAGGRLGPLLQMSQGQAGTMPMGLEEVVVTGSRRVPGAAPTHIMPGDIHVTATVTGMWRYIAGPVAPSH